LCDDIDNNGKSGAQDKEEAVGGGEASALAMAVDERKRRWGRAEGERGKRAGDYCTSLCVEGYRGTFWAKLDFRPF
jgi:hypothetical protein